MGAPNSEHVHALGTKFSQLLADTIIQAAPHVQQHVQEARAEANHDFLEGMEQHVADLVGPMLKSVAESGTVPPELTKLLVELGVPTEQFTGIISQFFIFGVMFTLAQAMLAPFVQQVNNDVWSAHPDRPLSPPDVATAVVRGIGYGNAEGTVVPSWATSEAAKSGLDADVFATMVGVTGMAPSLQLLYEMVRRGIIEQGELNGGGTTLVSGIQQSDIKDEWIDAVSKLRYVQPSPVDFVRAAVQAQMPYADAAKWATLVGLEPPDYLNGNPDWFALLYHTAGRPPGPVEMSHAANRGLVAWSGTGPLEVTFEQSIRESDIKDKYIPLLEKLAVYWPPSGEVRTLLLHGGITEEQALAFWKANGVPDALAKGYLHLAQIEQVTQDKALAKADIVTLVQENAISDADALTMLAEIGYSGHNAQFLLSMAHFRYELEAFRTGIRTVSTLYTSRKIDAVAAKAGFEGLGMPSAQIDQLLGTLTHQRDAETVIPTAAQVASALYYGIIDQVTAMGMLESLAYSALDAWLVLSVRMHGPLPNPPDGYTPPQTTRTTSTGPAIPVTTTTTGP